MKLLRRLLKRFEPKHMHEWSFHLDISRSNTVHRQCLSCPTHQTYMIGSMSFAGGMMDLYDDATCRFDLF